MPELNYDTLILGAGAAGMMCAIHAAARGGRVLIVDHARKPGEKIRISGGGRCNFTNIHTSPGNFLSKNPHLQNPRSNALPSTTSSTWFKSTGSGFTRRHWVNCFVTTRRQILSTCCSLR